MKFKLLILSFLVSFTALAQNRTSPTDSISGHRNTIRWNLTPMAVIGPKSFVIGYERIIKPYQSFSFNIGYLEKAPMEDLDGNPIHIFDQNNKGGFDFTADYRFYFKKRNLRTAPDGLYWGPYIAYYNLWQDASLQLLDNGIIKNRINYHGRFSMYSAGIQLGYQFLLNDRFTVDLILMGPSYSYYTLNLKLDYEVQIDPSDPFYKEIIDLIMNSNSFISNFLRNQTLNSNGSLRFGYYGFRYGIQIGYHF